MKHINHSILICCLFLLGCASMKPIAIYDNYKKTNTPKVERIFFSDSQGAIWSNLDKCGTIEFVNNDNNGQILLKWNKVGCEWVGFGNSWSSFIADDISEIYNTSAISFKVKAVNGTQKAIPFVIGLEDYSGGSSYNFSHLNLYGNRLTISDQEWTTLYIPLSEYDFSEQGVDPYGIKQMIIQLEGSGEVYLDDIKVVSFTKEDQKLMLAEVEKMKPQGNPNQTIYPGNFNEMAWGQDAGDCQQLIDVNNQIQWNWNNCEWNVWGINWDNWYAFNFRGIVEKTNLVIELNDKFDPFQITMQDYTNHQHTIETKNYTPTIQDGLSQKLIIPIKDFQLIEKQFSLDRMKQIEFRGLGENGNATITSIYLSENEK